MADTALPLVKAVIAALKADAGVSGLGLSGIYTDAPQGALFPYVLVSMESAPFGDADDSGQSHRVRIQCFSREASSQECLSVRRACLNAIDRNESSLSLDEGNVILAQLSQFSTFFKEDDGRTWQSVGELDVVVE